MADCGCGASACTTTCGANCSGTNSSSSFKKINQTFLTRTVIKSISGTNVNRIDNLNKSKKMR